MPLASTGAFLYPFGSGALTGQLVHRKDIFRLQENATDAAVDQVDVVQAIRGIVLDRRLKGADELQPGLHVGYGYGGVKELILNGNRSKLLETKAALACSQSISASTCVPGTSGVNWPIAAQPAA